MGPLVSRTAEPLALPNTDDSSETQTSSSRSFSGSCVLKKKYLPSLDQAPVCNGVFMSGKSKRIPLPFAATSQMEARLRLLSWASKQMRPPSGENCSFQGVPGTLASFRISVPSFFARYNASLVAYAMCSPSGAQHAQSAL